MLKRSLKRGDAAIFFSLAALLVFSYAVTFLPDRTALVRVLREDGPVENVGAIAFLLSSVFFILLYRSSLSGNDFFVVRTSRNVFYLLLGLLCFFVFGEEISWGQRIFGFDTPEFIVGENLQGEVTVHNLAIFSSSDEDGNKKPWWDPFAMSRMFRLFLLLFTLGIPVADRFSSKMSGLIRSVNIPVLPIWLGALFPLNYLISKVVQPLLGYGIEIVELEETNYAVLLAVTSVLLYWARVEQSKGLATVAES